MSDSLLVAILASILFIALAMQRIKPISVELVLWQIFVTVYHCDPASREPSSCLWFGLTSLALVLFRVGWDCAA